MSKTRMWQVEFGTVAARTVVAKNVNEAIERAVKRETFPGTQMRDVTKAVLIGEED